MKDTSKWSVFALLILCCQSAFTEDQSKVDIHTLPVKDNLYLLQGQGGNIVVAIGADGMLLVDDEYASAIDEVRSAVVKLTRKPIQFVINTHWHNDHTGGNESLGHVGAIIIAHDKSAARMKSDQVMSLYGPQAAYPELGWPTITFGQSMQMNFAGGAIDIMHLGAAHTDGDAIVLFRSQNVLCTGDLFVRDDYLPPYFDDLNGGSLTGMIRSANNLVELANDATVIIPGHGKISSRLDLLQYRDMLVTVRNRIQQGIADGKTENEIVATKPMNNFARPGKGTDRWVRIAYRELVNTTRVEPR